MNHPSMHGYRLSKNGFEETFASRMTHAIDATFRKSKIDRFGEIQGCGGLVSKIYMKPKDSVKNPSIQAVPKGDLCEIAVSLDATSF